MSPPPAVRPALAGEARAVAAVLTEAFVDEAGLNYWLRQGRAKERARRLFFAAAVKDAIHPARELWLADAGAGALGAAIWLGPGKHAWDLAPLKQLALAPLMLRIAGAAGMQRGFALGKRLSALHPPFPHAHLVFLGVAPAAQGRGVGSAMLKHTLAALDREGAAAFLETTTERNVALYRRHGFSVSGEIVLPELRLWTMLRPGRG